MIRDALNATGTKARIYERRCSALRVALIPIGIIVATLIVAVFPTWHTILIAAGVFTASGIAYMKMEDLIRHFHERHLRVRQRERVLSCMGIESARRLNKAGFDKTYRIQGMPEGLYVEVEVKRWIEDYGINPPQIIDEHVEVERRAYVA